MPARGSERWPPCRSRSPIRRRRLIQRHEPKDLQAVYAAKQALAQQLEARGQAKIHRHIRGIKFDITMEPLARVKDDRKIKTTLLISPNYEELELDVPATGDDTFKELVRRLKAEVMSRNPYYNEDVILAGCDKIATELGAKWQSVAQGGANGFQLSNDKGGPVKTMIIKFTANDASGKEKTYVAEVVRKVATDRCPSCGTSKGEIVPHNVVPQNIWDDAVDAAFKALGLSGTSPLAINVAGRARHESGAFGEAQKQCPHCETPGSVAKTGATYTHQGADLSLIQRGSLPNANTDPTIIGKQFGGNTTTPADLEAITRAHIKKVIGRLRGALRAFGKTYASDPCAAICDPSQQQEPFLSALATEARTRCQ